MTVDDLTIFICTKVLHPNFCFVHQNKMAEDVGMRSLACAERFQASFKPKDPGHLFPPIFFGPGKHFRTYHLPRPLDIAATGLADVWSDSVRSEQFSFTRAKN